LKSDLLLASSATNSPIADAPYHALHHGRDAERHRGTS
jgi:hypothetical protein